MSVLSVRSESSFMWVADLLLGLAAVAGHVAVVSFFFNRAYAHIVHRWVTKPTRVLFLSLTFVPPMAFVVWYGPELLGAGRRWFDLPHVLLVYAALCWGATGLVLSLSVVRRLRSVPSGQLARHAHLVDVAERLGSAPIGSAKGSWLARLPGNQVWQVEVVEQHLALASVPEDWQGLRIVQLSDLHVGPYVAPEFFHECIRVAADLAPDILVLTGDVADKPDWLPACLDPLADLQPKYGKFAITGNHDFWCGQNWVREYLSTVGFAVVDNDWRTIDVRARRLLVAGLADPWCPDRSNWPPDTGAHETAFRLCLTHTPDNIPRAGQLGMDLIFCGHNHGGQVRFPLIGAVYCPSKFGRRYDTGLFEENGALAYVSRGLSGNVPLRCLCRPEIGLTVLHPQAAATQSIEPFIATRALKSA
jgi:uncharacterized protein